MSDTPAPTEADMQQFFDVAGRQLGKMGVTSDEALLNAAAVGATRLLWRNSVWEEWHGADWGLSDGEMMRSNSATVKLVRQHLNFDGTDWPAIAQLITDSDRVLPDGRTLRRYATARRLAKLQRHAKDAAEVLRATSQFPGSRGGVLWAAADTMWGSYDWHGMPRWLSKVDAFIAAVRDPQHPHWNRPGQWELLQPPPTGPDELRRKLLDGPETLTAEAAQWCVDAMIQYVHYDPPSSSQHPA